MTICYCAFIVIPYPSLTERTITSRSKKDIIFFKANISWHFIICLFFDPVGIGNFYDPITGHISCFHNHSVTIWGINIS